MNIDSDIKEIYKGIEHFLNNLKKPEEDFSFFPALKGLTNDGKKLSLGFSCYALKIYYMLGKTKNIDNLVDWAVYINSFQRDEKGLPRNSYVDSHLKASYEEIDFISSSKESIKALLNFLSIKDFETRGNKFKKAINAETKQAISTLYEINHPNQKLIENEFGEFKNLELFLNNLNWNLPWDAGAQFSSFCVYSKTQNFNINSDLINFISGKVDVETGSYFDTRPSNPRQIINGAMKVITGLDWLGEEIHYPKNLIDFCLDNKPVQEGCDIVDFVYTLYMCSKQTDYKKKEINDLFLDITKDIFSLYFKEEGGFSYFQDKSQSHYYGIKITDSLKTPDLHGTLLCLWAINMILDNIERLEDDKQIIKP
tara:strand:- start:2202 stop:3305 length:1104 start_codon:yes stop_codon:yes gene_type:complete